MKGKGWKDAIEIAGISAIVASLIFVGIQLQLDRAIARSELTSDSFQMLDSIQDRLIDSDFAGTFAKMLEQPDELSIEERIQIDSFFRRVRGVYIRECYLVGRGILGECDAAIRATIGTFFGNRYGQSWWRLNGTRSDENNELFPFPNWVQGAIEELEPDHFHQILLDANSEE